MEEVTVRVSDASLILQSTAAESEDSRESTHQRKVFVDRDLKPSNIFEKLSNVYVNSLGTLPENTSEEKELKLKILTSWVSNLSEQNSILIQTVEQVEQEALDRVALLEDRLRKSSRITAEYMTKFQDCNYCKKVNEEEETLDVSVYENTEYEKESKPSLPEVDSLEDILKKRICNLQNDISGLLEIIRRARCYDVWDASGLNFVELTYEDIFG